jgi:hypothetical protein
MTQPILLIMSAPATHFRLGEGIPLSLRLVNEGCTP